MQARAPAEWQRGGNKPAAAGGASFFPGAPLFEPPKSKRKPSGCRITRATYKKSACASVTKTIMKSVTSNTLTNQVCL
jgi:hypothetical protein